VLALILERLLIVPTPTLGSAEDCSSGPHLRRSRGGEVMADVLYLGLTVVFFWLTWLLVKLCERL